MGRGRQRCDPARPARPDPFADAASLGEFARITGIVFGAVTRGEPAAIDIGDADVPDDDAEDAA